MRFNPIRPSAERDILSIFSWNHIINVDLRWAPYEPLCQFSSAYSSSSHIISLQISVLKHSDDKNTPRSILPADTVQQPRRGALF